VFAQETTAGLQGTVKDPSGAVVSNAHVVVTGDVLIGQKAVDTDSSGYYRFANLPPGTYTVTVTAKGFSTYKSQGLVLETGHLPTMDIPLAVGTAATVVEVNAGAATVDVTTNHTMTNVTEDIVQDVPHGRSFQSVIQFAPSARNEPLEGNNIGSNGTGGAPPGSTTNGSAYGFSVGGASDGENSYLVEGQETANLIGGYSHTNVPFDFIQEVQVKTSGMEAEHGGALGGVVNVIMRKGTNGYHGSIFSQFENDGMDGSPQEYHRYDPAGSLQPPGTVYTNGFADNDTQFYQPKRYHKSDVFPGFTFGAPIIKDRIFAFVGLDPEWTNSERFVAYPADSGGCVAQGLPPCGLPGVPAAGATIPFSRNTQTYYTTGRLDAVATQKIRLFGSWLYQYQRQTGVNLPAGDSTTGLLNVDASNAPSSFPHSVGYTAPNQTLNFGADITLTPHLVSTTRYGYYFENYHDFGYPTNRTLFIWATSGLPTSATNPAGTCDDSSAAATPACPNGGNPLPASLQQVSGHFNDPFSSFFTKQNANRAVQFDQDLAFFKSGWMGTHNFKFGYQLNRLKNDILQTYNEPDINLFVGGAAYGNGYTPLTSTGTTNCATASDPANCLGLYGYATVTDFGTGGDVTSFNHGLFAQDSWTMGHGVTLNAGVRFDKEYLPASTTAGLTSNPITFGWGDKVAPRIGVAWDVFRDGKLKVFGGYGKFFDIMKLNVAISSFGGQFWNDCTYTLDTSNLSTLNLALNSAGRFCVGANALDTTTGANWQGGTTPAGITFIENVNNRTFPTTCSTCALTSTGVVPGLKPFSQHESSAGIAYQLAKTLGLEARYDRRRLDHAIEDSSIFSNGNETFVIGNPGEGVESTYTSFYNFLYQPNLPQNIAFIRPACSGTSCVPDHLIAAARSYDGVEFRLTKTHSAHLAGMFSYTYSKLRGNYTGLTSSDISDGQQGGRSSPNNSRAFDEPYFQYNSFGGSSSGLLPTDRPNTFKGYGYYELSWLRKLSTNFGIFQYLYSGSPMTSYLDVGANSGGAWAVQAWDRGKWVDASQDPTTGVVSISAPRTRRTPWYIQTDFSITQNFKLTESKVLSFSAEAANLLNQRSVTVFNQDITSLDNTARRQYLTPTTTDPVNAPCTFAGGTQCFIADGDFFYSAAMQPYDVQALMNNRRGTGLSTAVNSAYGKPYFFQLARQIRIAAKFTF